MGRKLLKTLNKLSRSKARRILPFVLWPVVIVVVIFWAYTQYEKVYIQSIEYKGMQTTGEITDNFLVYLNNLDNTLKSCAGTVEYMMEEGVSDQEIENYLVYETKALGSTSSIGSGGVFGLFGDTYINGTGWEAESDYNARERIWYTEAIKNGGKFIFVGPYYNLRTKGDVVTVCKMLDDGESVIAFTIDYDKFLDMTTNIAQNDENRIVLIMNDQGYVIASSKGDDRGVDYATTDDPFKKSIYEARLNNKGKSTFFLKNGLVMRGYVITQRHLMYDLNVITITNAKEEMADLRKVAIFLGVASVLAVLLAVFLNQRELIREHKETIKDQNLESIANIYIAMYRIDLVEDKSEQIMCVDYRIVQSVEKDQQRASLIMREIAQKVVDQRCVEDMLKFTELSTLNERMRGKNTITTEFLNYEHIWLRARFIAIERDNDNNLLSVMFLTEEIDEEKRARDRLQYLAETDQLTGITNRGSGEGKISELLRRDVGGLFLLMDIDKFKEINDNYGHNIGDQVLIGVAEAMKHVFRDRDIIMRLGGDEFAAYAPGVFDKEAAQNIFERLVTAIHDMRVPELSGRTIDVSVGAAFYYNTDTFSFTELYKRADGCTYESKKNQGSAIAFYKRRDVV